MKSYKPKVLVIALAVLGFSCANEDLKPILTVDQLTIGAYPKLISLNESEYDLNNASTTTYSYDVEFVTEDGGANIETYLIKVRENSGSFVTARTYGQADFSTAESGNKSLSVSIPLSEVAALFGKTAATVTPLTTYRFEKEITLDDGRIFSYENSSPTVRGPAFAGDFRFDVLVTCPMTSSQFTGSYVMEYVGAAPAAFDDPDTPEIENLVLGDLPANVTINSVNGSSTRRRFRAFYTGKSSAGFNITVNFVCDQILNADQNTGQTCGGGNITLGKGSNTAFNFSDDSSFTLNFVDGKTDGGCAELKASGQLPFSVKLTKN